MSCMVVDFARVDVLGLGLGAVWLNNALATGRRNMPFGFADDMQITRQTARTPNNPSSTAHSNESPSRTTFRTAK